MVKKQDIGEDEIRVFRPKNHRRKVNNLLLGTIIGLGLIILIVITKLLFVSNNIPMPEPQEEAAFVSVVEETQSSDVWFNNVDDSRSSCIVVTDTIIDSIQLKILTPYNVLPELHLGPIDTTDIDIIFASHAADLGRDKGKIIGAFVYNGEPRSWGLSKKGYCAIFDDEITMGVAENSPLFEQATETGGSFFRQYPSVDNGEMVPNKPENSSFRRAVCSLNGKVCIVACTNRALMNDFSTALVKLGVMNAIFLVGGNADGWYRDENGTMIRLGKKYIKNNPNINYLVFRAQ